MTTATAKILFDGTHVPVADPRTDHVAVLFDDGVMAYAHSVGQGTDPTDDTADNESFNTFDEAKLGAQALDALGFDDWQFATDKDAERYFINRDFFAPAVDPNLFPGIRPEWHWVNKAAAWSSASAWGVYFNYGSVYYYLRGSDGFALAVRRSGQSSASLS